MLRLNNSSEFWLVLTTSLAGVLIYTVLFLFIPRLMNRWRAHPCFSELGIYLQRLSGMLTYGFLPLFMVHFVLSNGTVDYGVVFGQPLKSLLWIIAVASVIIPLSLVRGKTPANLKIYPQIRIKDWGLRIYLLSAVTWVAYLLSYEFFFRGYLLYASIRFLGVPWAIVLNVIIYALSHIPKGKFETIGAIPLGVLLCFITITTGSIWAAFSIHAVMALSNEWVSVYYYRKSGLQQ